MTPDVWQSTALLGSTFTLYLGELDKPLKPTTRWLQGSALQHYRRIAKDSEVVIKQVADYIGKVAGGVDPSFIEVMYGTAIKIPLSKASRPVFFPSLLLSETILSGDEIGADVAYALLPLILCRALDMNAIVMQPTDTDSDAALSQSVVPLVMLHGLCDDNGVTESGRSIWDMVDTLVSLRVALVSSLIVSQTPSTPSKWLILFSCLAGEEGQLPVRDYLPKAFGNYGKTYELGWYTVYSITQRDMLLRILRRDLGDDYEHLESLLAKAPAGGATIGLRRYKGGQFVPLPPTSENVMGSHND